MSARPPGWAQRIAATIVRGERREFVLGDLDEMYAVERQRSGRARANLTYIGWACRSALGERRTAVGAGHDDAGRSMLSGLALDFRAALRSITRQPVFTGAVIATLAVGIGAATAVFSIVKPVLLDPLPFADPNRLAVLTELRPEDGSSRGTSALNFDEFEASLTSFSSLSGWVAELYTSTGRGAPEQVVVVRTTGNLFATLGVNTILGRTLLPDEERDGDARVAVLSYTFFQSRFGGDVSAIGQTIVLNGRRYDVVGVMPPDFRFPDDDDVALWIPLHRQPWEERSRAVRNLEVIGRLAFDADLERAREEAEQIARNLSQAHPRSNQGWRAQVLPAREALIGSGFALWMLLGAVGFVVLMACANVANLFLARLADRRVDLTVRRALGAGQARVARLLILEAGLLAALGGGGGVALAYLAISLYQRLDPGKLPGWNGVALDGEVLAAAFLLTMIATLLSGVGPALGAVRRTSPATHRGGIGVRGYGPRGILVLSEVALAVILLSGAGLLASSLQRLHEEDPGFHADGLLTARIELPPNRYASENERALAFERIRTAVVELPGVTAAGLATTLPMASIGTDYDAELRLLMNPERTPPDEEHLVDFRAISPGYFEAMGIPLLNGRSFTGADGADAPLVAIIDRTTADRYFAGEDPISRPIRLFGSDEERRIVGVVGPVRHAGLDDDPRPSVFTPHAQMTHDAMTLAVRSEIEPGTLIQRLRGVLLSIDPDLPLSHVATGTELISRSTEERRFFAILLGTFAAVGLTLAVVGIYGVTAYSVNRRRRELGLRMAVGARARSVVSMVVGEAVRLAAIGGAVGLLASVALTRFVASLLWEVRPGDPGVLTAAALVLILVAALSALLPALRASRIDPVRALSGE